MSSVGQGNDRENPVQKPAEQQLNRACESCRLSKVRCLMDTASGSPVCQRCAKASRTCVFAAPQKRRQRKRTDIRVAELEREVRAMRALLRSTRISPIVQEEEPAKDDESSDQDIVDDNDESESSQYQNPSYDENDFAFKSSASSERKGKITSEAPHLDIVTRGIITMDEANEFVSIWINELSHYYPSVHVPDGCTAAQLRYTKPVLFLAIMAAASHGKGSKLSNRLHEEVLRLYADRLFLKGEKSVEFVQALLVSVTYYTPPDSPAQLQFYQYGNMAATMALELGLASKPLTSEQLPKRTAPSYMHISSSEELLENCRTILSCYLLTAGLAMRLRRPNILLFNSWMGECLTLLDKSPIMLDKRMAAWVKLQRIVDETTLSFGFDDASTSFSLTELRMQVILRQFERQMDDWKRSLSPGIYNNSLNIAYHQNIVTIWEFAVENGQHDAPSFKNKYFTLPALDDDSPQPEAPPSLTALQINAHIKCISSAQSLIDAFLSHSIETLGKIPNVLYVRSIYALIGLLKADYAIGTDRKGLGELMNSESLRIDYYLNMLIQKTTEAIGPQECRVPSHWLNVLTTKVKPWYDEYQIRYKRKQHGQQTISPQSAIGLHDSNLSREQSSESEDIPQNTPVEILRSYSIPTMDRRLEQGLSSQIQGLDEHTNRAPGPVTQTDIANTDSQWNFVMGNPAISTDISDFSMTFEQGDLYFWNDSNEVMNGWNSEGDILNQFDFGTGAPGL
ncbi:hypothetical protein K432DRAFT_434659 [Lepidopterella palustris CBS 459.81]|uniref:Zn(2)-C6 fungal-type domain-containing protein n=1 Tax=Lepidopterella palustris CBS 459.81 TaxID=1314670 RepID=A0A8E2EAS6_9PEZI|nr:hypothetical protein K432DRAFT_434659 [Lepidopterella palustris CBS 459.81]